MTKKARYYLLEGLKTIGEEGIKDIKNFFKHIVFGVTSVVGKIFALSNPLYTFGEFNAIKEYNETGELSFNNIIKDTQDTKKYWTTFRFIVKTHVITIIGTIFLGLISFGLIHLGIAIDNFYNIEIGFYKILFQILSGLTIVFAFIYRNILIESMTFFIWNQEESDIVDAVDQNASFQKNGARLKLFFIQSMYFVANLLYLAISSLIVYQLHINLFYEHWIIVGYFILSIGFVILAGFSMLSYKVSSMKLYFDFVDGESTSIMIENKTVLSELEIKFSEEAILHYYDEVALQEQVREDERNRIIAEENAREEEKNRLIAEEVEREKEALEEKDSTVQHEEPRKTVEQEESQETVEKEKTIKLEEDQDLIENDKFTEEVEISEQDETEELTEEVEASEHDELEVPLELEEIEETEESKCLQEDENLEEQKNIRDSEEITNTENSDETKE